MLKQNQNKVLILLLFGVYLPLQIFVILLLAVHNHEGALSWELPIILTIHDQAGEKLNLLAATLTNLGSFWTTTPLVIGMALSFLVAKRWNFLLYTVMTFLGAISISYTGKIIIHRARPRLWELFYQVGTDYSFPSGHAISSMSFALILIILTWNSSWRWLVVIFSSLFVISIAWTRLYLGVHYPSDIFAGWMIALAWTIAVVLMVKVFLMRLSDENLEYDR
ncbi:phosphoesterase PA-phosphatase related protein [Stanieria cyanosphaera PCC 7437]|uniref:Phosphoesterase PA-phosphatase related protein n=1 Tax=Stanieria cyanosphaera (strain ATCC 29371 / PCC 7437) TaxID=111780 RepID=K9XSY6_STAC7|nr:phosphatase PAP2 family protein [Stanieria cyanosphaera]AFZ35174.1 phosphoesterase PA-phosphatase related protein [Stanieria cyanosphaera PCC 7437]